MAAWPTAHTLAYLRIAERVAAPVARLATDPGGLTLDRAGFAPAGRPTRFHEVIAYSTSPRPAFPGRTGFPILFWAAFQNNAQFCNSTKRLYIHASIYEKLRDALVTYARSVKVGNGSDPDTALGPIQNEAQYHKVLEYIEGCRANRYRFALGGNVDSGAPGWFIPVTLVDDPPENSRIVREEPFGPILPLLKWTDESDVISRANDTEYGLGASVWGRNLEQVQRIGSQLEAGTVWLNEVHQYSPFQAFGGHKQSGIGCENSLHGMLEYTNRQTITLNKATAA